MMLARPYPTSCIEVSSLNPAAAARAAAILKVHHRYIQEGYLGDVEPLYPPVPGDVSQTLPALLDAAEQALRPSAHPLCAQARTGVWSNEAWAALDDQFRAHLRATDTADVDADEVIVSFLEALGLEPDDLQGAWSLARLYARVPALQARYLREQEQDAAEAMRERSFQWLSQRTKRTCDVALGEGAPSAEHAPRPSGTKIEPGLYNDASVFRPLLQYNGDASAAPFVFESGYLGQGKEGVLLEMNAAHSSRVSTSHYMLYGNVTARLRHNATAGLVASFGLASDIGDAIVFEIGGTNTSRVATNLAALGHAPSALGVDAHVPHFSFARWHNYTIAWQPDRITWSVDQHVVRTVQRSQAASHFPRSPSRVLFTLRGTTASSSRRERRWAGGVLNVTQASFRERGYYAQELSLLEVACAKPTEANVTVTGVGQDPIAYYYTGKNSSASGAPAFQLSRDQIRTLAHPAADGKAGMPGLPGAAPNGPRPNMYTGGAGHGRESPPSTSASNGVKIGVPLGVGLAVLACVLAILAYYFVRRHRRAQRRPPSVVVPPEPPQDFHDPGTMYSAYPLDAYTYEAEPMKDATPDQSWSLDDAQAPDLSHKACLEHDAYADADSDEASLESEAPAHMHYAGHNTLPRAEAERLAAQDAWDELRRAALGDDAPFMDSSTPFRARRGTHRTAYSDGGALSPPSHTPTLSLHGATGWNPRARFE